MLLSAIVLHQAIMPIVQFLWEIIQEDTQKFKGAFREPLLAFPKYEPVQTSNHHSNSLYAQNDLITPSDLLSERFTVRAIWCQSDLMPERFDVWAIYCLSDLMPERFDVWAIWCLGDLMPERFDVQGDLMSGRFTVRAIWCSGRFDARAIWCLSDLLFFQQNFPKVTGNLVRTFVGSSPNMNTFGHQ